MATSSSALEGVLRDFEEQRKHHDLFRQKVKQRYNAYRGVLEKRSEAAQWTSKLHPPYVLQVVETTVANIVDPHPRLKIRPRPQDADPETIQQHLKGSQALERLVAYQWDVDRFPEKQRTFVLQGLITGLSVGKCSWKSREGVIRGLAADTNPITDFFGNILGNTKKLRETKTNGYVHDDPTFENVDVRDFFWPEAAISLERAPWVMHRVWYSFDELEQLQKQGVYKNIADLKESGEFKDEVADRESDLFSVDRSKDMVEVLECWRKADGRVITVGNRRALLADKPWPFWHGEYPFIVTSATPDLFRIPGVSQVEQLYELQEMLWNLGNQRLDNLALINNAIILMRSDIDDPDAFEFAPGEKWLVEDPVNQVKMWTPEPMSAEISLRAEALVKGDLQNITGGGILSGADSSPASQDTATGVSIVTSLAQKLQAAKKQHYLWAWKRKGDQDIALLQQFMRTPRAVEIVGANAQRDFLTVNPEEIQGRYEIVSEAMDESQMRQERRAEAQGLFQVALQAAPVMAAVQQPLNMKAFVEDMLEANDKQDTERYFSTVPQPAAVAQGQPGQNGQPQMGPEGAPAPGGVTSPLASAPTSPSHQTSISPEVFMQRLGAQTGGPHNV